MNTIHIDVGVYTELEVDLREFDYTGVTKVILNLRNLYETDCITREFTTAAKHVITITPAESRSLRADAIYDFDMLTADGRTLKITDNGKISLRRGVGVCSQ